jgi:signal transduction histidine kinase
VSLTPADDAGGWRLETTDGIERFVAEAARADAGLRASAPLGSAALVAGGLALLLLRTRREWVVPVAAVAFATASTSVGLQGNPTVSTLVLAVACLVPAAWAIGRLSRGWRSTASLGVAVGLAIGWWTCARMRGWAGYDVAEEVRGAFAVWGTVFLVFDRAVLPSLAGQPMLVTRPSLVDVAGVAALTGGALALVNLFDVPPIVVAVLVVLAVVSRPLMRGRFRPIGDAVLADVRAQAKAEAVEDERARIARELHDVPLQELIGVIRRLEVIPGAEAESDDLRALAGHLRNVAIDLRPPVLDDLGLPAALEYLAEQTTTEKRPVVAAINADVTLDRAGRPPADVELAIYRIATEAVTNAIRHSGASAIEVRAEVEATRVDIEITDDGSGFNAKAPSIVRGKHIGLSSMRRRAQAIDADLSITPAQPGTRVKALWQA